ncbi:MAG TPA: hypothetical protein PLC79_05155, partial [Phycisphaerae bacterium]|nr:hypothetical protein [Phycisphaerae bacterium]
NVSASAVKAATLCRHGGRKPLEQACAEKGIDPDALLRELHTAPPEPAGGQPDWTPAAWSERVDHIVATHHAYLRRELPRVSGLANKVPLDGVTTASLKGTVPLGSFGSPTPGPRGSRLRLSAARARSASGTPVVRVAPGRLP